MNQQVLIKLPSRQRPGTLLQAARLYSDLCVQPARTHLLVSLDNDDTATDATTERMLQKLRMGCTVLRGPRTTKVGAINRDLPGGWPWDVLLVASDDQWPLVHGYDDRIREAMDHHYPDGDGGLWYADGQQDRICTQVVMGRKRYDALGHVYHSGYASYCCDDEYTERGLRDGKLTKVPVCLIRHEHHFFGGQVKYDALYQHNQAPKAADQQLLNLRRAAGWP